MNCMSPLTVERRYKVSGCSERVFVPCGHCLACRIRRRSEWTLRMLLESSYWDAVSFLTLTYDDEHLPGQMVDVDGMPVLMPTLVKRDVQLFTKRLRKALDGRRIKFFACGEYGDHTHRPHYHMILFGVHPLTDYAAVCDSWHSGFTMLKPVQDGGFAYVAGYVVDKLNGMMADDVYRGRQAPFSLCSKGLGKSFLDDVDKDKLLYDMYIQGFNGVKYPIPRYFLKHLQQGFDKHDLVVLQDAKSNESLEEDKQVWFDRGFENDFEIVHKMNESNIFFIEELHKKTGLKLKGVL